MNILRRIKSYFYKENWISRDLRTQLYSSKNLKVAIDSCVYDVENISISGIAINIDGSNFDKYSINDNIIVSIGFKEGVFTSSFQLIHQDSNSSVGLKVTSQKSDYLEKVNAYLLINKLN